MASLVAIATGNIYVIRSLMSQH